MIERPAAGDPLRIMVAYGTRPEAVKVAPLIRAMREDPGFRPVVVVTGQHREMLDQVNATFGIEPDVDLDIHRPAQSLAEITRGALVGLCDVLGRYRPHALVVQGDTSTTMAAALAAFYEQVPVVHLEAGLRTNDRWSPFPEEINRRLTAQLASLHLAPTRSSRTNLLAEGVAPERVVVVGNTVIDALHWTLETSRPDPDDALERELLRTDRPVLLVTAHRRESWGDPMLAIGRALARIAERYADHLVVFPMHRNPVVRRAVLPAIGHLPNVRAVEPRSYPAFCRLMDRARIILTDSGGVQEEGPSLGKPVLVLRETTERPEAVSGGTVRLVGTGEDAIVAAVSELVEDRRVYDRMARAVNPYGDGRAARRSLLAMSHFFGRGPRPEEFVAAPHRDLPTGPWSVPSARAGAA